MNMNLVKDFAALSSHSFLNFQLDLRRKVFGHHSYEGAAQDILCRLQEDLWSGQFIKGSTGHFRQLWIRDLGLFCEAYENTGQRERLLQSFEFALSRFQQARRITTTINSKGEVYDIFTPPADSLPLILRSLVLLKSDELILQYSNFLEEQAKHYVETRLDEYFLPRREFDAAGLKDAVRREGSLYTFAMSWSLCESAEKLGFSLKLPASTDLFWKSKLESEFWNPKGGFFYEDRRKDSELLSADVNLILFWLGLLGFEDYWPDIQKAFKKEGMLEPFPIKTTNRRFPGREKKISRLFAPNYQGDSIWANLGMIYLGLQQASQDSLYKETLESYRSLVEASGNFLELYNADGTPFSTWFYSVDEGLNWSVQLLDCLNHQQETARVPKMGL